MHTVIFLISQLVIQINHFILFLFSLHTCSGGRVLFISEAKLLRSLLESHLLTSQATLKPVASLSSSEPWQITTHMLVHPEPLPLPLLDPLAQKPVEWEEFVVGLSYWPTSPLPKTLYQRWFRCERKLPWSCPGFGKHCAFLVSQSLHLQVSWRLPF